MMENKKTFQGFRLFLTCVFLFSLLGCAFHTRKENVLAVVNNEPITHEDVQYSLNVEHRREKLSSARRLDISRFVQRLIDDRLLVEEAYRLGIHNDPGIQSSVQSFITRESVMKLYSEEVLQNISLTEKDIIRYYKKNYDQFFLEIITAKSENEALHILDQLKGGESFSKLAEHHPSNFPSNDRGEIVFARRSLNPDLVNTISLLEPGQHSETIAVKNRFYIVKLLHREAAPDDGLQHERKRIESTLRKEMENTLQKEYMEHLRNKASITIHDDILSSLIETKDKAEREKMLKDERTLAEVNGSSITVGKFLSLISDRSIDSGEKLLQNWIDTKLVDSEALSKHYEKKPDLGNKVSRYKNVLIKKTFKRKIIAPGIKVSDTNLREHYEKNLENYMKPLYYKIQQITVKTVEEANEVLKSLQMGAQFSWLAKTKSIDRFSEKGGSTGWIKEKELPEVARPTLKSLSPGGISPVLAIDSKFIIIRLLEKTVAEAKDFDTVKTAVLKAFADEQFHKLYTEYIDALRKEARITIYDDKVQAFEKRLK